MQVILKRKPAVTKRKSRFRVFVITTQAVILLGKRRMRMRNDGQLNIPAFAGMTGPSAKLD
jgi:hypothetical protein